MSGKPVWHLQPGVQMNGETVAEVAKMACALKSLSACTALVPDQEDNPEELQQLAQSGLDAMNRIF